MAKMASTPKTKTPTIVTDDEVYRAVETLKLLRQQGARNLTFALKLDDFRPHITSVARACGVAAYVMRALQTPRTCAQIDAEGERIFGLMRSAPHHMKGETVLHLAPAVAEALSMTLATAGLTVAGQHAGWTILCGPVETDAVRAMIGAHAVPATEFRIDHVPPYVPRDSTPDPDTSPGGLLDQREVPIRDPEDSSMVEVQSATAGSADPEIPAKPARGAPPPTETSDPSSPIAMTDTGADGVVLAPTPDAEGAKSRHFEDRSPEMPSVPDADGADVVSHPLSNAMAGDEAPASLRRPRLTPEMARLLLGEARPAPRPLSFLLQPNAQHDGAGHRGERPAEVGDVVD